MSKHSFTPGPWFASTSDRSIGPKSKDDDQSYGMILPVAWVEFDGDAAYQQANANLIASAPELLELVLHVRNCVKNDGLYEPANLDYFDKIISKALGK